LFTVQPVLKGIHFFLDNVGDLAKTTHKAFTATQYALFSSLIAVPRTVISAGMGWLAGTLGWTMFFVACAAAALPGMMLLPFVAPRGDDPPEA
jgi:PAT family beta-lactamase induction signal transducer AmpG